MATYYYQGGIEVTYLVEHDLPLPQSERFYPLETMEVEEADPFEFEELFECR